MLVCVPEPVCQTTSGKWSSSLPSMTSCAAWTIASARRASSRPSRGSPRAAARLTMPSARMSGQRHALVADAEILQRALRSARPSSGRPAPRSGRRCRSRCGFSADAAVRWPCVRRSAPSARWRYFLRKRSSRTTSAPPWACRASARRLPALGGCGGFGRWRARSAAAAARSAVRLAARLRFGAPAGTRRFGRRVWPRSASRTAGRTAPTDRRSP